MDNAARVVLVTRASSGIGAAIAGHLASSPEPIARLVEKILRNPSPRLRYSVGMIGQRIVLPLKRFLPHRLFETIVGGAMGV